MKTSPNDVPIVKILKEFKKLSDTVTNQIGGIKTEIGGIKGRLDSMDSRLESLEISNQEILESTNAFATDTESRLVRLEREQTRIGTNIVTKHYLDDKLADLHSDIVRHTKKEIEKSLR